MVHSFVDLGLQCFTHENNLVRSHSSIMIHFINQVSFSHSLKINHLIWSGWFHLWEFTTSIPITFIYFNLILWMLWSSIIVHPMKFIYWLLVYIFQNTFQAFNFICYISTHSLLWNSINFRFIFNALRPIHIICKPNIEKNWNKMDTPYTTFRRNTPQRLAWARESFSQTSKGTHFEHG